MLIEWLRKPLVLNSIFRADLPTIPQTSSSEVTPPACDLKGGDRLHTTPGATPTTVARVEPTGQAATVYNLTIEGLATYYVTTTTNTPTLVHNAYGTQVEYGSTELSRAVQAARLEARDRSHNYAAALLSDPQHTIIVARSRGKYVHAEDALEELRGDVAIKSLILGLNLVLENVDLASNKPELRLLILGPGTQVTSAIVRELQSLMP